MHQVQIKGNTNTVHIGKIQKNIFVLKEEQHGYKNSFEQYRKKYKFDKC